MIRGLEIGTTSGSKTPRIPENIEITLSIKEVFRINPRTFVNGNSGGPTVQTNWKDSTVFKIDSLKVINENRAFITQ